MGNLTIKIVLFLLLTIMAVNLVPWQQCRLLKDDFHFSKYRVALKLDDAIHNDANIPLPVVRFFHNKIVFYLLDAFNRYLEYANINFLNNLISTTGILGTVLGVIYLLRKRKTARCLWFIVVISLVFCLTELFMNLRMPLLLKIGLISFPYFLLSGIGYWFLFTTQKKGCVLVVVLLTVAITVYWQVFFLTKEVFGFCM